MSELKWERRSFLKRAGQGLAGASLLGSMPLVEAQKSTHKAAVQSFTPYTPPAPKTRINVRDLGAKGDGTTKDTVAIKLAIERASRLGGGEVVVPAGEYLTGPIVLRSNTTLRVEEGASLLGSPDIADYPFQEVRWEGKWIKGYSSFVSAEDAENIAIVGKGKIVASTAIKGRVVRADGSPLVRGGGGINGPTNVARQDVMRNPALMEFTHCRNVLVQDVFTQGNDMWSTHPVYCENVTFRNVTVHSGADGIDVDSCKGVVIEGCEFVTRDDCISLKSGRGMEGNTIGVVCEDVRISNCTFNDANFACIGIGSETSGGVRNVRIEHCKCVGARSHAIYIKSRPGRGAFVENISVDDFEVSNVQQGFLRLNPLNSGLQDPFPVLGDAGIPLFRNFSFNNIRVHDVPMLVQATEVHPAKPLDGLVLSNISGTCAKGITLANIHNAELKNINVTGYSGPLLSTYATTGKGLAGAVALEAPKVPDAVAAPAEPFVLK